MNRWIELILFALFGVFWVWLFYFLQRFDKKQEKKKDKKEDINDYLINKRG